MWEDPEARPLKNGIQAQSERHSSCGNRWTLATSKIGIWIHGYATPTLYVGALVIKQLIGQLLWNFYQTIQK